MRGWVSMVFVFLVGGLFSSHIQGVEILDNNISTSYEFPVNLKNGYHIYYDVYSNYKEGEKIQRITLMEGVRKISVLNEIDISLPQKNLGYIGADFVEAFVFVQSFGSGNPHMMQLINKETGRIIEQGVWVYANDCENILIYKSNEQLENGGVTIFDAKKMHKVILSKHAIVTLFEIEEVRFD